MIRDLPISVGTATRNRETASCVPLAVLALAVVACAEPGQHGNAPAPFRTATPPNPERDVYFFATHVHADVPIESPSPETAAPEERSAAGDIAGHDIRRQGESPDFFGRMERHIRDTCERGLLVQARGGSNPYKLGMVGGTDHPYWGVEGFDDHGAQEPEDGGPGDRSASFPRSAVTDGALAGVWAEEDTRESILGAMQRRETFVTSGPRIGLRFFGSWHYAGDLVDQDRWVTRAYERGVPMGGDLTAPPKDRAPAFVIWAVRDPHSAPLDRLQIVKGWIEGGAAKEAVYDVVCSGGAAPETATRRCPDNGASVDLSDCSLSGDKGDAELSAVWTDPAFDPSRYAFYYARVLENPTCRASTREAIRRGVDPPADRPPTVRQRALSSPIWYTPTAASR